MEISQVVGVEFLHKLRIIHRDLKPDNILIDAKGHLVIGDFGLARMFEDDAYPTSERSILASGSAPQRKDATLSGCGTPGYVAPEVYREEGHSYPADVWSLGVLMYLMLFGGVSPVPFLRLIPL